MNGHPRDTDTSQRQRRTCSMIMKPNLFRFPKKHSTRQLNGRVNPSISPTRGFGTHKENQPKKIIHSTMMIESWQERRTAPPLPPTHEAIRRGEPANGVSSVLSVYFPFKSPKGATISFYFIFVFVFENVFRKTTHSQRPMIRSNLKSFKLISLNIKLQVVISESQSGVACFFFCFHPALHGTFVAAARPARIIDKWPRTIRKAEDFSQMTRLLFGFHGRADNVKRVDGFVS